MIEGGAVNAVSDFPPRTVKPFRARRAPRFPLTGDQIVSDPGNAAQHHSDLIGCALFQNRDDILATFAALAADPTYRAKLGALGKRPFDALAGLSNDDQSTALAIASLAMNRLIESFAEMLGAGERTIPGGYCVDYQLESRLSQISGAKASGVQLSAADKCTIAGDDSDALLKAFPRWLNSLGSPAIRG